MARLIKVGLQIRKFRKLQKLTQIGLARISDTDYSTIRKVESGAIRNPSSIFCAKIAVGLGVNIDMIISTELPHATQEGASTYFSSKEEVLEEF